MVHYIYFKESLFTNFTKHRIKYKGGEKVSANEYRGLSTSEIEDRLKEYGLNELQSKKGVSPIKIFLSQFNDVIIWILMVATFISGFMGDKADAITILIIVIMNAILGFVQEYKTEKSLEQLKKLSAPTAKVIRNGKIEVINSIYLVPGDLVILETGDRIPADSILVEGSNLILDESLLTGESVGVHKTPEDRDNNIFMGTIVLTGRGKAKVYGTGMNTEMGKIANIQFGKFAVKCRNNSKNEEYSKNGRN